MTPATAPTAAPAPSVPEGYSAPTPGFALTLTPPPAKPRTVPKWEVPGTMTVQENKKNKPTASVVGKSSDIAVFFKKLQDKMKTDETRMDAIKASVKANGPRFASNWQEVTKGQEPVH